MAFINTASSNLKPNSTSNLDFSSLRGFFEYFDEDVILWQKRYSWELVREGHYRHYLSDISVFVELINLVMSDIKRHCSAWDRSQGQMHQDRDCFERIYPDTNNASVEHRTVKFVCNVR